MQQGKAAADGAGPAAEPGGDLVAEGAVLAGPGAERPGLLAGRAPLLIAAALDLLLQEARDSLYLSPPAEGDPAQRLRLFARVVYGIYDRQGDSLTTLLEHRDDAQIGPRSPACGEGAASNSKTS
jgi:hypothetical protein